MKGVDAPDALVISRVCAEFNCLPSQARDESLEDIAQILRVRSYEKAKSAIEAENIDEEQLARLAIPEYYTLLVFENIERKAREGL